MNLKDWSRRNINYYKSNFARLSQGRSAQFNWAAFLGGPAYWAYRKMYAAAIGLIIFRHLSFGVQWLLMKLGMWNAGIGLVFSFGLLIFYIWLANNANRFYYGFVREQVHRGYDRLERFKPTSAFLFWLVYIDSGMSTILALVGIVAYALADKYANNLKREEDLKITSEDIDQYLEGSEEEHDFGKKAKILIGGLIFVSIIEVSYSIKYAMDMVQSQLVAEKTQNKKENESKVDNKVVKESNKKSE